MTENNKLMYVAPDGDYGSAAKLLLIDTDGFTHDDYVALESVDDGYRQEEATELSLYKMNEPLVWAWMTEDEAFLFLETIEHLIGKMLNMELLGFAGDLGDIRDVLLRSHSIASLVKKQGVS
jgi:hypothetical protein